MRLRSNVRMSVEALSEELPHRARVGVPTAVLDRSGFLAKALQQAVVLEQLLHRALERRDVPGINED